MAYAMTGVLVAGFLAIGFLADRYDGKVRLALLGLIVLVPALFYLTS